MIGLWADPVSLVPCAPCFGWICLGGPGDEVGAVLAVSLILQGGDLSMVPFSETQDKVPGPMHGLRQSHSLRVLIEICVIF